MPALWTKIKGGQVMDYDVYTKMDTLNGFCFSVYRLLGWLNHASHCAQIVLTVGKISFYVTLFIYNS